MNYCCLTGRWRCRSCNKPQQCMKPELRRLQLDTRVWLWHSCSKHAILYKNYFWANIGYRCGRSTQNTAYSKPCQWNHWVQPDHIYISIYTLNALLQRYEFIPYQLESREISQVETRKINTRQFLLLSGFVNWINKF